MSETIENSSKSDQENPCSLFANFSIQEVGQSNFLVNCDVCCQSLSCQLPDNHFEFGVDLKGATTKDAALVAGAIIKQQVMPVIERNCPFLRRDALN